jgi:hypothetical protein
MENAVIFIQNTKVYNLRKFAAMCILYSCHVANQQWSQYTDEHKSKLEDENIFSSEDTRQLLP